jgi:parallel beta-helix repeat protein
MAIHQMSSFSKNIRSLVASVFSLFISMGIAWAAGPTYVHDAISVSTEWTQANSPYILQNDVAVQKGAVLTIDPGVTVQFMTPSNAHASTNLVIQGAIKAVGAYTNPIHFVPATTGSLWGALYFVNADSANCLMQDCVVNGGSVIFNACSPTITQCAVEGSKVGLELLGNSQAQIVRNRITGNGVGIAFLDETVSPTVTQNEIDNNNYGIYLKNFQNPVISGNRIYGNLKYNMVNYSAKPLAAPNNDFHMADAQQIMRTVYDGAYNGNYGRVNFIPYVGMAQGQTVSPVVASNNTVTTEKPTIQEEDFWNYGRPFDAMKVSNVMTGKKKSSGAVEILAVGVMSAASVAILFL